MTDLRDQLQASLGTTYTIERELGGGGMSRVLVTVATALARHIVSSRCSPPASSTACRSIWLMPFVVRRSAF
jgi:serine/threonine-protein kinase